MKLFFRTIRPIRSHWLRCLFVWKRCRSLSNPSLFHFFNPMSLGFLYFVCIRYVYVAFFFMTLHHGYYTLTTYSFWHSWQSTFALLWTCGCMPARWGGMIHCTRVYIYFISKDQICTRWSANYPSLLPYYIFSNHVLVVFFLASSSEEQVAHIPRLSIRCHLYQYVLEDERSTSRHDTIFTV